MNKEEILKKITEMGLEYGPKFLGAIAVWIIGSFVLKMLNKAFAKAMDARELDDSLKPFLKSLVKAVLRIVLIISVLSMLGIEMTSFIAILGAASLAIGMALSGTLQNFAGGVMLLIFKPYQVGDVIEAQGYTGKVSAIQIFNTILKTPDNKTIIIPNAGLSKDSLVNYSTEPKRRVDFTVGIGYGDSVEKANEILLKLAKEDPRIINDPAEPFLGVSALADSSVNIAFRVWVESADYWAVYFEMNQKIYNTFNAEGINIPFPQMDVHLIKE